MAIAERHNDGKVRLDLVPASWIEMCMQHDSARLGWYVDTCLDDLYFQAASDEKIGAACDVVRGAFYSSLREPQGHELLISVANILESGLEKYDDWNWANGMWYSTLMGSINRHYTQHLRAVRGLCSVLNEESCEPDLAHVMCNLLFMRFYNQCYGDRFNDLPHTKIQYQTEADKDRELDWKGVAQ